MSDPLAGKLWRVDQGDAVAWLNALPAQSVDLVFGSPPYTMARLYLENGENLGIARNAEQWAAWMLDVFKAALRVCRGLVAFVVEGQTKNFRWDAAPVLLMADLHRAGITLRKPPVYHRVGIPGSGGPDWLRNDFEWIVCATNGGRLPWSDNTALGHPPKWAPGGEMSHRLSDGQRVNQWGMRIRSDGSLTATDPSPSEDKPRSRKPSHVTMIKGHTKRTRNGETEHQEYTSPAVANPGNVIDCVTGGGQMGSAIAHENEAPFPEYLAEFFIRSFCPENGITCDPFSGSGTTAAVAVRWGRRALCCDLRQSQVDLSRRRIKEAEPGLFTQEKS